MTDKLTEEEIRFLREFIRKSLENDAKLAVIKWNILERIAAVGVISTITWVLSIVVESVKHK